MTDREKMVQRIKHLMNHSKSAESFNSQHEAEAFMTKATKLMSEYNILMHEIESAQDRTQEDEFKNWGYSEYISYDDKHLGHDWKFNLMRCIANHNFVGLRHLPSIKQMRIFGRMENVDMAIWLYSFAVEGLYALAQKQYKIEVAAKKIDPRTGAYFYKKSFLLGAVDGLDMKLYKERQESASHLAIVKVNDDSLERFYWKDRLITPDPNAKPVKPKKPKKVREVKVGYGYQQGYVQGNSFQFHDKKLIG